MEQDNTGSKEPLVAQPVAAAEEQQQPVVYTVVPLVNESQNWPMPMCCSMCYGPCDLGLCCYTHMFTVCAAAEISEKIGNAGLFSSKTCCEQCCAVFFASCCVSILGNVACGIGGIVAPWIYTLYYANVRDVFKKKFRLPHDELCCDSSWTTFMPYFLIPPGLLCFYCTPCATYQQAYFLKHRTGKDLECCCYETCCRPCSTPIDHSQVDIVTVSVTTQQPTHVAGATVVTSTATPM